MDKQALPLCERKVNKKYDGFTKLMVVGGAGADYKVEIVDLSGEGHNCPNIADNPKDYGTIGAFVGGKAVVCGGEDNTCHSLSDSSSDWQVSNPLNVRRDFAAGVMVEEGRWWVIGGDDGSGNLFSTQVYEPDTERFVNGWQMPFATSEHQVVRVNETHYVLMDMDRVVLLNR